MHLKHFNRALCLLLLAVLCLCASGCHRAEDPTVPASARSDEPTPPAVIRIGDQELSPDAQELTAVIAVGETALLDELPKLRFADLSGSENLDEIAAWAAAHPQVTVRYTIPLPDGSLLPSDTTSYDLSTATAEEAIAAAPALARLPALESVNLGAERESMGWEGIARLREILPQTTFQYSFDLYGTSADLSAASLDLYTVLISQYDEGELLDQVMGYMPQLRYVDIDSCGLPMWRCEEINLKHPDVKVVFRVWFGNTYSVRTDVEKILASKPSVGGMLTNDTVEGLYYCHDVKYLDVGHNDLLTDIGFVAEMPKLEVAVLAMCGWTDASPLSHCPELEYLEMQTTNCNDLSPLAGLQKLRHLNVAGIGADSVDYPPPYLTDISPLYSLTGLERLWLGSYQYVPQEQIDEMQRCAPDCEINTSVDDPTGGRWRYVDYDTENYIFRFPRDYHPRYVKLLEQFAGPGAASIDDSAYAFRWNDPLYPGE